MSWILWVALPYVVILLIFFALSVLQKVQNAKMNKATKRVNEVQRRVMAESIANAYGKP